MRSIVRSTAALLNFRLASGIRTTGKLASAALPSKGNITLAAASDVVCKKRLRVIMKKSSFS